MKRHVVTHDSPSCAIEPESLQSLCINVLCYNHTSLCDKVLCERSLEGVETDDFVGYQLGLGKFRLPVSLSQDLFSAFNKHKLLNDENLQIFNSRQTNLNTINIVNNSTVTLRGLEVLSGHSLSVLHVKTVGAKLEEVLSSSVIGRSSEASLRVLEITDCESVEQTSRSISLEGFRWINENLRNLVSISLVSVKLPNQGLEILCRDLSPSCTCLDISDNPITDVTPLLNLSATIKSLCMYNLYSLQETTFKVLADGLPELIHLDISCDTGHQLEAFLNEEVSPLPVEQLLQTCSQSLSKLQSLDISGREQVTAHLIRNFLKTHPGVTFVGLMLTPASDADEFHEPEHIDYISTLTISSLSTEDTSLSCLLRYFNRHFYVQKALVSLFQMTKYTTDTWPRAVQVIVKVMTLHLDQVSVQMAGTACLYNLTKDDLGNRIHTGYLKIMVACVLDCMAKYPTNEQLQKNCLLILCTDRILVEVSFDKYRCAQLAMDCLCKFEEDTMVRMILAITSILAAKITTEDTSKLASNPQHMLRLIEITRGKMRSGSTDSTMKFALSALWNLTDESPKACKCFYQHQGLELAIDCLKQYNSIADSNLRLQIQTKVVGLLNNVAEVKELKGNLITPEFINLMRESLRSDNSEYSYFSAGILANLLSDVDNPAWEELGPVAYHVQEEMINVISKWPHPTTAMVAYRCFRPFSVLLSTTAPPAVQYWALWAIDHVCVKDAKRYVPLLISDGIYADIVRLSERDFSSPVCRAAQSLHEYIQVFSSGEPALNSKPA